MGKNETEQGVIRFKDFMISRDNNSFFNGFTIQGDDSELFNGTVRYPKTIDGVGFCICLQGECEVSLDQKRYIIKKNDLCAVFPYTILQAISKSDDFVGYTLAADPKFIFNLEFPSRTMTYLFIKDNPCIHLSDSERDMIIHMSEQTKAKDERVDHPYRTAIATSMLTTICYEIAAIYKKTEPLEFRSTSRKEMIFQKFLLLVASNYKKERNVDYYAQELCITPKYLSFVCKDVTGKSALDWISGVVILNTKTFLKDVDYSIKEVSNLLNFPNPSFFGQYFKRHTGITPKEYRKQYMEEITPRQTMAASEAEMSESLGPGAE